MVRLNSSEDEEGYRGVPIESVEVDAPLDYHDVDYDTKNAISLDVPKCTRRKTSCCVCCYLDCGVFCKALGIAILIFVLWNGFKLVKWMLTPSATGLENMPQFDTSLGCLDVTHFYQDNKEGVFYTVPVGSDLEHDIIVEGGAVGTIVLAPATNVNDKWIKVRARLRTSDSRLFNNVEVHTPNVYPFPPSDAPSTSYFSLTTPTQTEGVDTCMRYDLTVYVPPNLRRLRIAARSVAQVKVDFDYAPRDLRELRLVLSSAAAANLVLPSANLMAENIDIVMRGGYLVGTIPIVNKTSINTSGGDAITKLDVFTSGYELPEPGEDTEDNRAVAHLYTLTGVGRTDVTYANPAGRPVRSEHIVERASTELHLTYKDSRFNGKIDVDARSYITRHVQSSGLQPAHHATDRELWVGNKDGGDYLKVFTQGRVWIYF